MTKKTAIRNLMLILALLVFAGGTLGAAIGATYAVWVQTTQSDRTLDVPMDEYNPSEKYLVFRGLDASGNFVDESSAVGYAVVGYTGLVAEVIIPSSHNGKDVTAILAPELDEDFSARFRGNPIITSIVIPATVVRVGQGVCADMSALTRVSILGSAPIAIGDLAFANCVNLSDFINESEREIAGERRSYLLGTGLSETN